VSRAYLSLGSNLGDRAAHLRAGVRLAVAGDTHRVSSVYETEPWGPVPQGPYWNLVVELDTTCSPEELLARCASAEDAEGRTREQRWGPRTLDVDIVLVEGVSRDGPELTLPHPRMWERRFVLVPLAELAPELVSRGAIDAATGEVTLIGTLDALD
jgi:2-amino-4-hydroxy-6-hydroxymethyldihydropteridine diphosphokinase